MKLTSHDIELMQKLYHPDDGAYPLPVWEIAVKFGVAVHMVYRAVNLSPRQLALIKRQEQERAALSYEEA